MVNIQLLCVGKLKEKHFSAACAEYQKRLGAFCKLTVTELPEVRLPEHPTPTQVEQWMVEGASHLTLIIGGSFGLHPSVKEAAHLRLSMSPMTFPHHLARVMVLEQVYRAFQIAAGTRYHK